MLESNYQANIIRHLEQRFPDCIVMKMDSSRRQGWPDLLVLYRTRWATLEVKVSEKSKIQPNQAYYVQKFNELTFSSFIYPENEKQVMGDLEMFFADA